MTQGRGNSRCLGDEMKHGTKIEWTHIPGYKGETWNPVRGEKGHAHCVKTSPGCANCYAEKMSMRGLMKGYEPGVPYKKGADRSVLHVPTLDQPLRWTKPRCVFVCSITDLFLPEELGGLSALGVLSVLMAIQEAPDHLFLLLTKHIKRARDLMREWASNAPHNWPLPNLWLGVTAENQEKADERIPVLLDTPAARRFVSCEPLLGPIAFNFGHLMGHDSLSWTICGGESWPKARRCDASWITEIADQSKASGVPCFVKQWGSNPWHGGRDVRLKHSKGGDPAEWLLSMRVQEFPV